jgi:hypothetical protein
MTLIAEALATRKDLKNEINDLQTRISANAVKFEDDDDKEAEDPEKLLARLRVALGELQDINVRINETNNETSFKFDNADYTVMEAIAYRERLLIEQRALKSIHDSASVSRYNPYATRTKDEIKTVRRLKVKPLRKEADDLAKTVRRLDMAIQQVNWTTELS